MCQHCYEGNVPPWSRSRTPELIDGSIEVRDPDDVAHEQAVASRRIGAGMLWILGGLGVTALSYAVAGPGGTYIIAWGGVIYGAQQVVRGLTSQS